VTTASRNFPTCANRGRSSKNADVVLFINRPNFYKTDLPEEDRAKAELIIAKQRNGPTGSMNFVFLARHTDLIEARAGCLEHFQPRRVALPQAHKRVAAPAFHVTRLARTV